MIAIDLRKQQALDADLGWGGNANAAFFTIEEAKETM